MLCLSLLIVAAPDMSKDLGPSSSDLQWVIDGHPVPYTALMLVLGSISDKCSRRGALVLGLPISAGGSVAGSRVHHTDLVITAHAGMGVGAAAVMPATGAAPITAGGRREGKTPSRCPYSTMALALTRAGSRTSSTRAAPRSRWASARSIR
ncbi:hypothetical protein BIV25_23940 [Streptomyces sp. MUSC 14]|nr:hypothetical protein BIV25_23940 [Streptomyces sp. MUSC 14]